MGTNGLSEDPGCYISNVGINDLSLKKTPLLIAESIVDLAKKLKSGSRGVRVSNIIVGTEKAK